MSTESLLLVLIGLLVVKEILPWLKSAWKHKSFSHSRVASVGIQVASPELTPEQLALFDPNDPRHNVGQLNQSQSGIAVQSGWFGAAFGSQTRSRQAGRKLKHWEWVIGLDQLDRQVAGLTLFLQKERAELHGTWPHDPLQASFVRELEIELAKGTIMRDAFKDLLTEGQVKKQGWLDSMRIRLWKWSQGR